MSLPVDPRIICVASYPKSGNTWVRCLIMSLLLKGQPIDLNDLQFFVPPWSSRRWVEQQIGQSTQGFSPDLLRAARARAATLAAQKAPIGLFKIHDRLGPGLLEPGQTRGIIYIVRDPRDIAPSWAAHAGLHLDTAIAQMGNPQNTVALARHHRSQIPQHIDSWSNHVMSWLDGPTEPTLLIRYEDLSTSPERETHRLAQFLGIRTTDTVIEHAVKACDFQVLRQAETNGFAERPATLEHFFRQGKAAAWQTTLTRTQSDSLERDHATIMKRLGYLRA